MLLRPTKCASFMTLAKNGVKTLRQAQLADGLITLRVRQGDLTMETTDAIVNPANSKLQHGGALAAYIVKQGGSIIQEESDIALSKQRGLQVETGNAIVTGAGRLPHKKIIHAVGPVWEQGGPEKVALLKSAVNNSLELAGVLGLSSVAIPAISSGVFGFPRDLCAQSFFEQVMTYAEKKASQTPNQENPFAVKTVRDIRLTNIDDETVQYFIEQFDKFSDQFDDVLRAESFDD